MPIIYFDTPFVSFFIKKYVLTWNCREATVENCDEEKWTKRT